MSDDLHATLLADSLAVAVPLWIDRYAGKVTWEEAQRRARICADHVAAHGDVILYRDRGTAEAFNRLAEGIALASFQPGGITFAGTHWESHPPFPTLDELTTEAPMPGP